MSLRDLKNNVDAPQTLTPVARTANVNGSTIDLRGFDSAMVVFVVGIVTDGTHTPAVEEAPDDGTGSPGAWTAVVAADLEGTLANLTTDAGQRVGYKGNKRFLRAQCNSSGATGAVYGAVVNRALPSIAPVA